jgi:hypothetical protein
VRFRGVYACARCFDRAVMDSAFTGEEELHTIIIRVYNA